MMIFGAALLGRSVGTGYLENDRVGSVRRWSGVARAYVSVLPVSSVPEVFDRWSAGERSELIGSEFLDVLPRARPEGPTRSEVFADGFVGDRGSGHCRGMRGYAGLPHGRHRFDDVLAQLGVRSGGPVRRPSALFCLG
ncbi:hypothetical protein I551_0996 [Mycobacterium ulcerans str. Harvey]|uniref:Uncharacterized protein n=1 Tax=Mycobacterium ulcerans str. Harvey TaxID=1299332 RepID=A0ABN0R5X7_MYCUL|nr:hypothetical protein I551_0996 [Mycobacterium ulcerans str. Harvey]